MHLYDELNEIPIPEFAHSDGYRVYVNYPVGNGLTKKLYIGQFANKAEGTFYANENFRLYYPVEWAQHYEHAKAPHYQYNIGMYAMALKISHDANLYQVLHDSYGPLYGNAILDFAMYSIMERSNVAYRFKPAMEHEVIFSKDRNDDDWLSKAFNSLVTQDMTAQFKIKWIQSCKKRGILKVWIGIDGSNNDCECSISELPNKTENKSRTNKTAVGYMYAVSAENGEPVTFSTYYGDEVDPKAFIEMCEFIESNGIEIEGVVLDRGFLSHKVLELVLAKRYQFVIMLKNDTYAHTHMVIEYGSEIYWNVGHLVGEDGLFGISDGPRKIFNEYADQAYINLFFDAKNGSERKITFVNKVYQEIQNVERQIKTGIVPIVSESMKHFLHVETVRIADGIESYKVEQTAACSKMLFKKGFESIASSKNLGPKEAYRIYHLRDASEKQFMISNSMLGGHVFRVHTTEGILSKSAICFVASILRNEIGKACKSVNLKLSLMLPQIERPVLALMGNGTYKYIPNMKGDLEKLFLSIGCSKEYFDVIAGEVNERESAPNGKGVSQYHRTPDEIQEAHRRLKEARKEGPNDLTEEAPHEEDLLITPALPHPGRPKGRKNNKTLAREAEERKKGIVPKEKRKPGRPLGSKNKKTLEKEKRTANTGMPSASTRKRGRPLGSKDKSPRTRRTRKELEMARGDGT